MKGFTLGMAAMAIGMAAPAALAQVVALTGDGKLAWIDPAASKVTGVKTISGAMGRLVGIDVRPANGMLYGLGDDGTLYTVDAMSGKATAGAKLNQPLPKTEATTVDFNPVADRLRVIAADGTNYRINVDTGDVVVDKPIVYGGTMSGKPKIMAGAYTNSMKGAISTALYDIDGASGTLFLQNPPNDGVLQPVGTLGIAVGGPRAFDIVTDSAGNAQGWLLAAGTIYQVDLKTGLATPKGPVQDLPDGVIDIAFMPAM